MPQKSSNEWRQFARYACRTQHYVIRRALDVAEGRLNHEDEKDKLYNQIGRLKVEVDWLKKKTGHLD